MRRMKAKTTILTHKKPLILQNKTLIHQNFDQKIEKNYKLRMKKFLVCLIIILWGANTLQAQCLKIDSLERVLAVLNNKPLDSSRINTMNAIALEWLKNRKLYNALGYANQAMAQAKIMGYSIGIADALIVIGGFFVEEPLKREKETIPRYKEALEIYEKSGNPEKIAYGNKVLGDFYYNLFYEKDEHFTEALGYYLKQLEALEKTGNKLPLAKAYAQVGNLYDDMGEDAKSKEYFLKAVELRKQMSDAEVDDPHLFAKVQRSYETQIYTERFLNYGLGGGLILMLLFAVILFINIRQKQKTNQLLLKQNEEIEKQRQNIEAQKIILEDQKHEIQDQHDKLVEQNQKIKEAQEEIQAANEKLVKMNSILEDKVAERTLDLSKSNEALTEANEELDTLIYRASHDFKGPVATLTGLAQVARFDCEPDSPAADVLNKIEYTAQKMDLMLEKLHQVSYLIGKPLSMNFIDFREIIEQIQGTLLHKMKIEELPVQINLEIEDALYFYSDAELLAIVLENMLENCIHYRTQTPQKIPNVWIEVVHKTEFVHIKIRDNGLGIPEKYFPEIFDMFFRGNELAKGNGLGLYVVRKALEKMSGSIEVESEENEYTLFRIKLPK
jgi:signal transduction histidine kinase